LWPCDSPWRNRIELDRHYNDDAAKKAMVRIFSIVGQRSRLADDYRERLTRVLYS
jgi:thioredoxin-like negative regulator of GroEL